MTINREVFLSLLAMDSYNRGPGALVGGLSESGQIGQSSLITTQSIFGESAESVLQSWQAAGFYALAYEWDNNGIEETVISFRGTNFPSNATEEQFRAFANDLWGGWNFFLGFDRPSQADFAQAFYKEVTSLKFRGEPGFIDPLDTDANIVLTGHSLGGALAGYVGARADAFATVT